MIILIFCVMILHYGRASFIDLQEGPVNVAIAENQNGSMRLTMINFTTPNLEVPYEVKNLTILSVNPFATEPIVRNIVLTPNLSCSGFVRVHNDVFWTLNRTTKANDYFEYSMIIVHLASNTQTVLNFFEGPEIRTKMIKPRYIGSTVYFAVASRVNFYAYAIDLENRIILWKEDLSNQLKRVQDILVYDVCILSKETKSGTILIFFDVRHNDAKNPEGIYKLTLNLTTGNLLTSEFFYEGRTRGQTFHVLADNSGGYFVIHALFTPESLYYIFSAQTNKKHFFLEQDIYSGAKIVQSYFNSDTKDIYIIWNGGLSDHKNCFIEVYDIDFKMKERATILENCDLDTLFEFVFFDSNEENMQIFIFSYVKYACRLCKTRSFKLHSLHSLLHQ
eukprot:CAMPEP_0176447894 /NCGR_PEP_ID=MMETSP0127-20121128/25370_1 /TAXON_ID=938130 /ORGANISM="Platyophrya macrostoma, Strain WH" /LENGTH=390 /DNA_ID=CAMNT_0017834561 /DNA_START=31 /DNA_END=1203 /DNA_ORIENTATION=+